MKFCVCSVNPIELLQDKMISIEDAYVFGRQITRLYARCQSPTQDPPQYVIPQTGPC